VNERTNYRFDEYCINHTQMGVTMAAKKKSGARKVKRAMHKMKRGTLKSGRSGKTVKKRKQAIAIGLSEARKAGAKIPKKKKSARKR
jgi:Family of unknown function (DUF6496)